MNKTMSRLLVPSLMVVGLLAAAAVITHQVHAADAPKPAAEAKPALTVTVTQPQRSPLQVRISANGNVAAWQEASVGAEANGLRLAEVKVNVGDVVKRGQVLARFAPDTVQADVAQVRAGIAEAEAMLAEATANAQRARELQPSGALSAQQTNQYLTAERTAAARLEAQKALAKVQQLRLAHTQVVAPDHGVISARMATVGAVVPAGQELFRLIRQGRLEWRAEVPAADLARLKPGMVATVYAAGGEAVQGKLRMVAPTVDAATRNGIVYVDLPAPGPAKAGMFARGDFDVGRGEGLTLPQSAVLLRDGFSYVLKVGADSKVLQAKVSVGRRQGDRIEITAGLTEADKVVAAGGGFLGEGDTVRVVPAGAASTQPPSASGAVAAPAAAVAKAK
jgi:HlyD family secretion protein